MSVVGFKVLGFRSRVPKLQNPFVKDTLNHIGVPIVNTVILLEQGDVGVSVQAFRAAI